MNSSKLQEEINKYYDWLHKKTTCKSVGKDWVEITTPYLDRHNDSLQIYAKHDENEYLLTDDGYIITDLNNSGCALNTQKRKELLTITLNGFGVKSDEGKLSIKTSSQNFPASMHSLLQCMLAINDLFYLSETHIGSFFQEDVKIWLDHANIRYIPRIKLVGKSGFDHMFDFAIAKSNKYPERIVQAINNPDKESALQLIAKWMDTSENREKGSKLIAILNNENCKTSRSVMDAFEKYDAIPILWSEREKHNNYLAA